MQKAKLFNFALILGLLFPIGSFGQRAILPHAHANELCESCVLIGIIPLKYDGDQKKIAFYAQGTQDSLIHALSSVKSLVVVDRTRTHEVLKEIAFQQSAYVDQQTQIEIGQILGVQYLYTGSMQEVNGQLRIIIERINVATGQVNAVVQVTGQIQNLFELQDQIAQKILEQAKITFTSQEQQEMHKQIQTTSSLSAYEYFARGLDAQNNKNVNLAITEYGKAIEIDPKYTHAYNNRGLAYNDAKQYEKSIEDYNKAIENDPTLADPYNNRGWTFYSLSQYEKAIADYNKAIERNPKYALAYNNRGIAHSASKHYDKAIADYNKAIEVDPQYALAYNNRGYAYYNLKQYDKAITDFNKAIVLNPKFVKTYINRGWTYAVLKQYEKAIDDYNKALEYDPNYAYAYNNRGLAYHYLKQYDKKIEDFKKACQLGIAETCTWLKENGH